MQVAAESDWVDVELARLNPAGVSMDADVPTIVSLLAETRRKGKGIIGMKILGAGKLRPRIDEMLQYALAQDVLDCFTIRAEHPDELQGLLEKTPAASVRA